MKVKEWKKLNTNRLKYQKQIALNMKSQGLNDEFIAKCLDVDLNTLQRLLNS